MSGTNGINDWEDFYEPSREFIERLEAEKKMIEKLRHAPNRDIARDLYRIAEQHPEYGLVCCEAAERLSAAELTETEDIGRN